MGSNRDWLMTLRQSLPRLRHLVSQMNPTWTVASVADLSSDWFAERGIAAAVWDVDGTLTSYHGPHVGPELEPAFRALRTDRRLSHAVLSNCGEDRFLELSRMFPDLLLVRAYEDPRKPEESFRMRQRIGTSDSMSQAELEGLLRGGARQVRKPDGRLIRETAHLLGVDEISAVVMIGDQYLTDVATANLGGARSIKLLTYAKRTFPFSLRLSQSFEGLLFRLSK